MDINLSTRSMPLMSNEIVWTPTTKQRIMLSSTASYVLFGGS